MCVNCYDKMLIKYDICRCLLKILAMTEHDQQNLWQSCLKTQCKLNWLSAKKFTKNPKKWARPVSRVFLLSEFSDVPTAWYFSFLCFFETALHRSVYLNWWKALHWKQGNCEWEKVNRIVSGKHCQWETDSLKLDIFAKNQKHPMRKFSSLNFLQQMETSQENVSSLKCFQKHTKFNLLPLF